MKIYSKVHDNYVFNPFIVAYQLTGRVNNHIRSTVKKHRKRLEELLKLYYKPRIIAEFIEKENLF